MLKAAFTAFLARGGAPEHEESVLRMRRAFERRTGAFGVQDAWFEARSAAFWDDAITGGFARRVLSEIDEDARADCERTVEPLERSHRGLFRVVKNRRGTILECALTGAAFFVDPPVFQGAFDALAHAEGFVEGFVCAVHTQREVQLLPGAIFHSPDASHAIETLIERAREMEKNAALDAFLRMDRTLHAMSRPKAQLAYRPEALTAMGYGAEIRNGALK